jgi:gamma-glutamyltranspeptidase/glutathione hydrolase
VHAEPGVDEPALEQLEAQGRTIVRWDDVHHYFGGVSCVARGGPAADPRRDGAALTL